MLCILCIFLHIASLLWSVCETKRKQMQEMFETQPEGGGQSEALLMPSLSAARPSRLQKPVLLSGSYQLHVSHCGLY